MSTTAEPEPDAGSAVSCGSLAGSACSCCCCGAVRSPVRAAGAVSAVGRCTVGVGGGGGGGASEETTAAVKSHSTSASTVTVGDVATESRFVSAVTFARVPAPEGELSISGTAAALEAPIVSASPEEAKTARARLPLGPVTALPKAVSGVEGRHAARCRALVVRSVKFVLHDAYEVSCRVRVGDSPGHPGYPGGTSPLGTYAPKVGSPAPVINVRRNPLTVTGFGVRLQVLIDGGINEQPRRYPRRLTKVTFRSREVS